MEGKLIWDSCLQTISKDASVSRNAFNTWFKNTHFVKEEDGTVCVGVPNDFIKNWLIQKYQKLILKILVEVSPSVRSVDFVVTKMDTRQNEKKEEILSSLEENTLPLQDLFINKDDNLNPKYTFDTFVVGDFNHLAYAAAQAVIDKPGINYNPFFVYGGTGLGKTHLIQSIGNEIKTRNKDKKIYYMTLEQFYLDCVNAIQNNKINLFKEKYRKYDVVIIDDVQFIARKDRTQEELFHLFNTLYDGNKQIIFSSDKHPNHIPDLEKRMQSRFSAGMIVDISEPEYESKMAILKAKLKDMGVEIAPDVLDFLASSISGSIRELEGSLNAVLCQTKLKQKELTINDVKQLVRNNVKPKKTVSVPEVVKIVSMFYNLDENVLYEKTRRKEIVHARQIAMYVLREDFNVSYPHIGQKLGGKDHTTVIHSCLKIKEEMKEDQNLSNEIEQIRAMFK
ncbi:MAG: chromosomal replication initiator protein DnaA [Candidatus Pacebacteria bacterium]|nr:chromosomal replication initiator protein DnaA [Candidatus Paceibacterota bacterium]MBP9058258.1 chromosomal replication initiator protein DnaA [Candidatus Paceibacterota bacterium]MBP9770497.1 chromosomal replication initiator protein DnaA [Candidatus Paceibacterota bacterium]